MILCISGKLVAIAMDFLNYMLEALVRDYFPFDEKDERTTSASFISPTRLSSGFGLTMCMRCVAVALHVFNY